MPLANTLVAGFGFTEGRIQLAYGFFGCICITLYIWDCCFIGTLLRCGQVRQEAWLGRFMQNLLDAAEVSRNFGYDEYAVVCFVFNDTNTRLYYCTRHGLALKRLFIDVPLQELTIAHQAQR